MQAWAFDQILLNGINLGRGGRRAAGVCIKPHGDVVGMGVEILYGVGQSAKSDPGREDTRRKQGCDDKSALFDDVPMAFVNGVVIVMEFIMADLTAEGILFAIGRDDDLKRTRTDTALKGFAGHFLMNGDKHFKIIPSLGWRICAGLQTGYNACMTFYTAKGDDGTTGLLGEGRVPKYHARMEAVGALDEASAALGLARAQSAAPQTASILLEAQRDLYKLMAEVAATPENAERFRFINEARVKWLEEQTNELSAVVEMPKEFILPGDTLGGAALSMARAIIRRAERRVVGLFDEEEVGNPDLQRYLNRLSSLCFVLELLENQNAGKQTTLAKA